jgi:hypothetical protein
LSLPSAPAAAGAGSAESSRFRGYHLRALINWRVPGNARGVDSTTAAIGHFIRKFAQGHNLGCSVEWRRVANGLEISIDGVVEQVVDGQVAASLRKKFRNTLAQVGKRKGSKLVAQCQFIPHVAPPLAAAEVEVLERIHGRRLPRVGFQSWWKFLPKPLEAPAAVPAPAPAPAPVSPAPAPAPVSPAHDAVAMALAADLVNLRSEYHGALGANDFANGFDKAVGLLSIVLSFVQGPGAAASGSVQATGRAARLEGLAAGSSSPKAPAAGPERISNGAAVPPPCCDAQAGGAAASLAAEAEAARGGVPRADGHS